MFNVLSSAVEACFAHLSHPLTSLLNGMVRGHKPGDVHLSAAERQAFEDLKTAFTKAPVLQHFNPTKPIIIETDASNFVMGAILSQKSTDDQKHPVAFWSAKFTGAASKYCIPDKEMMAIVESFKHWRHYLEGNANNTTVLSDHNNLQGFMSQTQLNGRQARWSMYLAGFGFTIKHQPGKRTPPTDPRDDPTTMTNPHRQTTWSGCPVFKTRWREVAQTP